MENIPPNSAFIPAVQSPGDSYAGLSRKVSGSGDGRLHLEARESGRIVRGSQQMATAKATEPALN
jgi:hypothetical protein